MSARAVVIASGSDLAELLNGSLDVFVNGLPGKPVVAAVVESLKAVTSFAEPLQLTDAVGSLWAALALGQGPANREKGVLLTEAGAKGQSPEEETVHATWAAGGGRRKRRGGEGEAGDGMDEGKRGEAEGVGVGGGDRYRLLWRCHKAQYAIPRP